MQSFGLALTMSLLTATLVALDLYDWQGAPSQQSSQQSSNQSAPDDRANALSVMPSGLPGIVVPKADINNGVFSIGSSTGKEGLDNDTPEMDAQLDAGDDEADAQNSDAEKASDFVLV